MIGISCEKIPLTGKLLFCLIVSAPVHGKEFEIWEPFNQMLDDLSHISDPKGELNSLFVIGKNGRFTRSEHPESLRLSQCSQIEKSTKLTYKRARDGCEGTPS